MAKKTFILPVEYSVCTTVAIEADNIEEALRIYNEREQDIPLDANATYLDESYKLSFDEDELIKTCGENPGFYKHTGSHGVDGDGHVY